MTNPTCKCGNSTFYTTQKHYVPVLVNADNEVINTYDGGSTDTPEGPYQCSKCKKEYASLDDLDVITEEQEKAYVIGKGRHCPSCGSDNLDGGVINYSDGPDASGDVTCFNCNATWADVYTLSGITNFKNKG